MGHSVSSDMDTSQFYGGRSRHHDMLEEDLMPVPDDPDDVVVINFGKKFRKVLHNSYLFFFLCMESIKYFFFSIENVIRGHHWFYAPFQTNLSYQDMIYNRQKGGCIYGT